MAQLHHHLTERGPGRLYQRWDDHHIRYADTNALLDLIKQNIKSFVAIENCARFLIDGKMAHPTAVTIAVPFESELEVIYDNLTLLVYQQMWGYYLSADPKTTHFGLTHLFFDGNETSLVRREIEKFLQRLNTRHDISGRVLDGFSMASEVEPFERDVYMRESLSKFLDICLAVRVYTFGEGTERVTVSLPIEGGASAIDRLYYNLEHLVHMNLIAYDELHDRYLPISDGLLAREVEGILRRATQKENTRKRLVHGLKFYSMMLEDGKENHRLALADRYYDKINRIDLFAEAAQRSRELLSTGLVRSSELATESVAAVADLSMEERVYIERPAERELVSATVVLGGQEATANEAAQPVPQPLPQPVPAPAGANVHGDGLEEL